VVELGENLAGFQAKQVRIGIVYTFYVFGVLDFHSGRLWLFILNPSVVSLFLRHDLQVEGSDALGKGLVLVHGGVVFPVVILLNHEICP
jgi:hypothetical protein